MRRILARHQVRDSHDYEWTFKLLGPDDSGDATKPPYVVAMEPPDSGPHALDEVVRFDAGLFEAIGEEFARTEESD